MSCDTSKATPIAQKLIDMLKNLPADADDKFSSIFGSLVFGKLDSNITATIDYPPEPSSTATDQQKSTYTYLKNIADALTLFQNCPIIKLIKNALPTTGTTGTTGTGTTGTSLTPDDIKCALDTVSDVIQSHVSDMVNTYKLKDDTLDDIQTKVQLALNIKKLYLLSLYSSRNQDTVDESKYADTYYFFDKFYDESNTKKLFEMKQTNPTDFDKYKFTLFGYPNSAGKPNQLPKALFEDVYDFKKNYYPSGGVKQTTFFANIPDIYNKFMYVLKTKLPLNPPSASPSTGTGSGTDTGTGTGSGSGLLWFFLVLVVVVAGVLFYFLNRLNINLYRIGIVIAVFLLVSLFFVYKIHTSPDNNPPQQPPQQPPAKDTSTPNPPQPEVFLVSTDPKFGYSTESKDAENVCKAFGATVATIQQLEQAYNKGADWCNTGWTKTADGSLSGMYPINTSTITGCGNGAIGIMNYNPTQTNVNCYGVKPAKPDKFNDPIPGKNPNDKYYILPFNGQYWSSAEQTQPSEVFYVAGKTNSNITSDDAQKICKDLNSVVAPKAQLQQAWLNGADWCSPGWTSEVVDGKTFVYKGYYPNNTSFVDGCGRKENGNWIPQIVEFDKNTKGPDPSGVNCYGVKPSPNYSSPTYSIANFNCMSYHSPNWKCEENPEKLGDYAPIRINNDGDKQCITVNANDTTNCNWMGSDPAGSGNGKARCEADMRAALTETIQNGSNIKTWEKPWTCLEAPTPPWQPNTWAPFRLDKYGNPQLLTNDLAGKNGLFSKSEDQCKASIQNALAGTNGTITCGTDHKTKFPNEDQSAPDHWCVWSKKSL